MPCTPPYQFLQESQYSHSQNSLGQLKSSSLHLFGQAQQELHLYKVSTTTVQTNSTLISESVLITNSSIFQLLFSTVAEQEDAFLHLISIWIPSILNVTDRYTMGTEKYHLPLLVQENSGSFSIKLAIDLI